MPASAASNCILILITEVYLVTLIPGIYLITVSSASFCLIKLYINYSKETLLLYKNNNLTLLRKNMLSFEIYFISSIFALVKKLVVKIFVTCQQLDKNIFDSICTTILALARKKKTDILLSVIKLMVGYSL